MTACALPRITTNWQLQLHYCNRRAMQLHIPEISMKLQPLQGQESGTSQESRAGVGSPRSSQESRAQVRWAFSCTVEYNEGKSKSLSDFSTLQGLVTSFNNHCALITDDGAQFKEDLTSPQLMQNSFNTFKYCPNH